MWNLFLPLPAMHAWRNFSRATTQGKSLIFVPSPDSSHTSFRQVTVLEMWLGRKASGQRNWNQNNEGQSCVCLLVGFKNKIQISDRWLWLSLHVSGFSTTASWVWRNDTFCIFSLSCLFNDDISACLIKEQIVSVFCRTVRTVSPSKVSRIRWFCLYWRWNKIMFLQWSFLFQQCVLLPF